MTHARYAAGLFLALLTGMHPPAPAAAQGEPCCAGAPTPHALAAALAAAFAGPPEAFERLYPFPEGRGLVRYAASRGIPRRPGAFRVLRVDGGRALLLLSGHAALGNSGDETDFAAFFSALYEAADSAGGWRLVRRLPAGAAGNRIVARRLGVELYPGQGLRVVDTLDVAVSGAQGFAAHLNHRARLEGVRVDGRPAEHVFGGGLLWARVPPGPRARVVVAYTLEVESDTAADPNSGAFRPAYGHVRGQYYWHPRFHGSGGADLADVRVAVRAPAAFRVATSLPQTERVAGGARTVVGRAAEPTSSLTLVYDRDWRPTVLPLGVLRFETFAVPGFRPGPEEMRRAAVHAYRVLGARFGEPSARYFAVAQARARSSGGWHFRANDLVVAGPEGGATSRADPIPRAPFGHEVAHGWTHPTGPAANFLREGWATYAESLLLADEFGPAVEAAFWEAQRNAYEAGGFEGAASLLNDPANSGVSYSKGAWVFRMLRDALGDSAFHRGLRAYMRIPAGESAGAEELAAALSRAAGWDVGAWLRPWLTETAIPDVEARVEGGRLVLLQRGPVFDLPLEVDLVTPGGTLRRRVRLASRADTLPLGGVGPVTEVRLDPGHRLLLKRRRGEVVRFELRAPHAGSAALGGDFALEVVPAERGPGGAWSVRLPLPEGRYAWNWLVDGDFVDPGAGGDPRVAGVLTVLPLFELPPPPEPSP